MKRFIQIFLVLTAISLQLLAAPKLINANIIQAEVGNFDGIKHSAKIEFSLEKLPDDIAQASIAIVGDVRAAPLCPSLTLRLNGKAISAYTMWNKPKKSSAMFFITKYIQQAKADNKKSVTFEITQEGENNKQSPFSISAANLFVLGKSDAMYSLKDCLCPIFKSGKMTWESVFPLCGEDGSLPKAKLFFKADKVLEAFTFDKSGKVVRLEEGKDFKVEGDTFKILPNSRANIVEYNMMYSNTKEGAEKFKPFFTFYEPPRFAFFREGDWFHKHHIYISYQHSDSFENPAKSDSHLLKRTIAKLKKGKNVTITLYGDSISHGANASAKTRVYPYMPSWGDLVVEALRKHYKNENITYLNRALGGSGSAWGELHVNTLVSPDKPDLAIIAFGMNDRMPAPARAKHISKIIEQIKIANPKAEIMLVCAMTANPLWKNFEVHTNYHKSDLAMRSQGIAVADVRSVHKALQERKRFLDMTGNNVNHPNDFLIRVYAQTVLSQLIEK